MEEQISNNKKIKIVPILLGINLVIIIVVIFMAIYYSKYTIDTIIELGQTMTNIKDNYRVIIKQEGVAGTKWGTGISNKTEIIVKNGIVKESKIDDSHDEKNESIKWHLEDREIEERFQTIYLISLEETINLRKDLMLRLPYYASLALDNFSSDYRFKFIKEEKVDEKKCAVIQLTQIINEYENARIDKENTFSENYKRRIWIDKQTGLIVKIEYYGWDDVVQMIDKYEIEFDNVMENELVLPDTSNYVIDKW